MHGDPAEFLDEGTADEVDAGRPVPVRRALEHEFPLPRQGLSSLNLFRPA